MKTIKKIFPILCFLVVGILAMPSLKAQTVDKTGVFDAIRSESTNTILFASLTFYDVDFDNVFDASLVLSAGPISAWIDYSASIAFYAGGIQVRNGESGGFVSTNTVTFESGTPIDIWIDVDVANKVYSTWARTGTSTEPVLIYENAAFRRADIDSICRWSALHNSSTEPDTVSIELVEFVNTIGTYPVSFSDASCSELSLDVGTLTPAFEPGVFNYTVLLPEGTASVNVSATTSNPSATILGTGYVNVSPGTGNAILEVTAIDHSTTNTYTIDFSVDGNYAISLPGGVDGSFSNIQIPALQTNITGYPYTVEMWVNPSQHNNYSGLWVSRDASNGNPTGLQFDNNADKRLRIDIEGSARVIDPKNAIPTMNRWNHLAVVVTSDSVKVILNGSVYKVAHNNTFTNAFSYITYIGLDPAAVDRTITGMIDEIRFWNVERTEQEIEENKFIALQGNETGLVAYFPFDNKNVSATDVTGNGYDGTITGGVYVPSFVRAETDGDGVYNFVDNCPETANSNQSDIDKDGIGDICDNDIDGDGIDNLIDNCPETSNADQEDIDEDGIGDICDPELPEGLNFAISLPGGSVGANSNVAIPKLNINNLPVTVEMWYKPDKTQNNYATLWYTRGTSNNCGVQYDRWSDQSKIKAVWNGAAELPIEKPIPDEWNHVALVVTSTSKTLYINGVGFTETGTSFSNFPFDGITYLGYDDAEAYRTLKGLIDEVRIWNVAKTAQELEDNKFSVLNGNEPNLIGYWNFDDRAILATDATGNGLNGTITGGTYVLSFLNPMIFLKSESAQKNVIVNTNSSDNVAMCLKIKTKFSNNPLKLYELYMSAKGTTNLADISGVKVYTSGNDSTFSTANLIGQLDGPLTSEKFQMDCENTLLVGKNYLWITYDIAKNAAKGNTLDVVCDSFKLASAVTNTYIPNNNMSDGNLEINPDLFIQSVKLPIDVVTETGYTSSNGANFVSFQQNAIMTYKGYQYVTYWNHAKHVCLARKKIPVGEWKEIEFSDYTSSHNLSDNHYNISFGICEKDGTIHLAFDHHNDPLNYRVSVANLANTPEEVSWTKDSFGPKTNYLIEGQPLVDNGAAFAGAITYPRFISKPDSNLLFECRTGWSGDGNSHLWEYSGKTGTWEHIGEYMHGRADGMPSGYTSKCGYINGLHYTPGSTRLHVSLVWREEPNASTNHEVYYAYSDDDGRTWYNAEGTQIGTSGTNPVNYNSTGFKVYSVGQNRGLINQESQAVDSKGGIHILQSYMLNSEPDNSAWPNSRYEAWLRHIYQDESGTWQNDSIASIYIDRSEIAVDENDNLYVVTPGYRVYFASAAEKWQTWTEFDISENGTATAEGLIDRESLLNESVLSFVFAHKDYSTTKGKIIVPYYLIEKSKPGTGTGLNIVVYDDTEWQSPISQKLDAIDIKTSDISVSGDQAGLRITGTLETQYAEAYTLYLTTSGNTKVWINGQLALETGDNTSAKEFEIPLTIIPSHKYEIVIEGIYSSSSVITSLEWSSESQDRELVPISSLYGQLQDGITGISEPLNNKLTGVNCYPNPFKSTFTINASGLFNYEVMNIDGKIVAHGTANSYCEVGNNLSSGIYILKVKQNNKHTTLRLVKE